MQSRWLGVGHLQNIHELSGHVGGVLEIPDCRDCAHGYADGYGYGAGHPEWERAPSEPDVIDIGFADVKDGRDGLDGVMRFMDDNSDKDRKDCYK
ncbi:hypothetical protein [Bifidobacterium adolescentis]|uniref:hypothetical protein n=1 Tax=Bifidobacterium adolescentis TaxID=1680 RepID=UPI0022E950B7|nr:hypothetical protein [Bifidobacterium adolescentis]